MSNFFEEKKTRNVLPNWRSFANTNKLGELSPITENYRPDLSELNKRLEYWQGEKNIGIASDIINTALFFSSYNGDEIKNVARYILDNSDKCSKRLIEIAEYIHSGDVTASKIQYNPLRHNLKINLNDGENAFKVVHTEIGQIKARIITNPANPILWVELCRCYSMIGQSSKAFQAIKNAISLNKENRFLLRSLARFGAGNENAMEFAHDTIRMSLAVKHDPWVTTAEIALANLRGRRSIFIKNALELIANDNISPFHISELSSAIGTIEVETGNIKKGKKYFEKALLAPNDNVLAQTEWVSQKHKILTDFDIDIYRNTVAYEAYARDATEKNRFENAMDYTQQWFLDQPFSKQPVLFATYIAETFLEQYERAIRIGKIGLISHPNDSGLLNNIAFASCMLGELSEADRYLKLAEVGNQNSYAKPYILATRGLYYYRIGNVPMGRQYYLESIKMLSNNDDSDKQNIALGNMAREELMNKTPEAEDIIARFIKVSNGSDSAQIMKLLKQIKKIKFSLS
jgi:hypothetical protein